MNREIKFRAWDKETEQYFKVLAIDFKSKIVSCRHFKWKYDPFNQINLNDLDLEQFTGLKDKNGKNIYEGDVVRVSDVDGNGGYVDTVIWGGEDNYPAFDLKNHAVEYDSNALSSIVNAGFEIIEVIGNVHANPELLEADK